MEGDLARQRPYLGVKEGFPTENNIQAWRAERYGQRGNHEVGQRKDAEVQR